MSLVQFSRKQVAVPLWLVVLLLLLTLVALAVGFAVLRTPAERAGSNSQTRTVNVLRAPKPRELPQAQSPLTRIVYRDRWHAPLPADCAEAESAARDSSVRVVAVPRSAPPLVTTPSVRARPDRVVVTYRAAEDTLPGRTVQDVYAVPEARWGYAVAAEVLVPVWGDSASAPVLHALARVRYRAHELSARAGLDALGRPDVRVGVLYRFAGRP